MVMAYKPDNLHDALNYISSEECVIFAGGTDLMVKHKQWSGMEPDFSKPVVFTGGLDELKAIKKEGGFIKIGSALTLSEMLNSPLVPRCLKKAAASMASPAVRNSATIGGNICNSSPAGDTLPVLYALNAVLHLTCSDHCRDVKIQEFITGPGKNIRKKDEILEYIKIPDFGFDMEYIRKVGTRNSKGLSKLSFAGLAIIHGGRISDIRLAFGAVGPTVIRDVNIEKSIIEMGHVYDTKKVLNMYRSILKPIDDQRSVASYREEVSIRLAGDFLKQISDKI